jgi:hypothetical protein
MANDESLKRMREYSEELRKDPARLKVFLRQVMGRPHRTLEGKEKDNINLLLTMIEPFKSTNNQHSMTQYFMLGDKEYHVTMFVGENTVTIDEMLPEDEE